MNRATRLSLIAVMLLATTALGILSYKSMFPDAPEPKRQEESKREEPPLRQPQRNPEYTKLENDLKAHERRCLDLAKQATIILPSPILSAAQQRVKECQELLKIERDYVTNFPDKTI